MKSLVRMVRNPPPHWVGDGFPVRSLLSYSRHGHAISPFLMLDYGGPHEFAPSGTQRGVGEHPHKGFETVTIVYQGEVAHRDSTGSAGVIGPGDVQWMTAGSGLVHEERHTPGFSERGGTFQMVQLWVNLPARAKELAPGYQTLLDAAIPRVAIGETGRAEARVIAGSLAGASGPAKTQTPVHVWDLRVPAEERVVLDIPAGQSAVLAVLEGALALGEGPESEVAQAAEAAIFDPDPAGLAFRALEDSIVLVLAGEPIEEPIAGYGPFVMNTEEEIRKAVADYQAGRMGRIAA